MFGTAELEVRNLNLTARDGKRVVMNLVDARASARGDGLRGRARDKCLLYMYIQLIRAVDALYV